MPDPWGPLERLKQQTYVVIISVGLVGAVMAWFINELTGTISPFTRGVFAFTSAVLALQMWLARSRRVRAEALGGLLYAALGAVVLSVILYALYLTPSETLTEISLVSLYLWLPLIYVFVFLIYDGVAALVRSGILYALILGITLPHALSTLGSTDPFEGLNTLGQLYISTPAAILILFFLTKMKDRLRESQIIAERMELLASTDPLTGIPNRRQLERTLEEEMERSRRYGKPLSVIAFDIDDFKHLNDTLGHDAGDIALVEVARLVESHLRASDRFGRWGGEEFVIVAPETSLEAAQLLSDRLRTAIEGHIFGWRWRLSASFGVASYRQGDSMGHLFKRADVALYRAKERGKNRVEVEHAA